MVLDKTLVLIDTNNARSVLSGSPRYDTFDFGSEFSELRKFVTDNRLDYEITFAIAQLTLSELLAQKKKAYGKDLTSFTQAVERLKNLKDVNIPEYTLPNENFDCIKELTPLAQKFIEENNIKILKIEDRDKTEILDVIVKKVIDGTSPFKKNQHNNSKDLGFKDALIFETLRKHPILEENANVILFTQDGDFKGCEKELEKVNFKIIGSKDLLIEYLKAIHNDRITELKYESIIGTDYFSSKLTELISSELDVNKEDVVVVKLNQQIIETDSELRNVFDSEVNEEGMIGLKSRIKVKDRLYFVFSLIDLGANVINMIQVSEIE